MEKRIAEILYTVMFGLCFSWMGSQMLKDILPLGTGHLKVGIASFILRSAIIGTTFILSAITFLISISWCQNIKKETAIIDIFNIILVILNSLSPWLCYHIARILLKPFSGSLYKWDGYVNNVDVLFVLFYSSIWLAAFGLRALTSKL